jgi:hypothetical protein
VQLAAGGISARFAAPSISGNGGSTTLTITAGNSVSVGTYTFTVAGTGGGKTAAPITVTLSVGTFSMTASAPALTVARSGSATLTLNTSAQGGFSGPLTLSASRIPKGVGVTFSPATLTNPAAGVTTVKFTVLSTAVPGTQNVTLTATNSGASRSVTVALKVQ